jgi:hypothetical protein
MPLFSCYPVLIFSRRNPARMFDAAALNPKRTALTVNAVWTDLFSWLFLGFGLNEIHVTRLYHSQSACQRAGGAIGAFGKLLNLRGIAVLRRGWRKQFGMMVQPDKIERKDTVRSIIHNDSRYYGCLRFNSLIRRLRYVLWMSSSRAALLWFQSADSSVFRMNCFLN